MHTNKKKSYAAPELTVVSFAVERGFAASQGETLGSASDRSINDYSINSSYGNDDNNSVWN